jgi:hypothetical protein
MLTAILSFIAGVLAGAVGAVFVARNNRSKIEKALGKADDVSETYKNYMTKWSDNIKK